jgi:hypothetical protein
MKLSTGLKQEVKPISKGIKLTSLLLGLLLSAFAHAESLTVFPTLDTNNTRFLDTIAKAQWTMPLTHDIDQSLRIEAGARNYRFNTTLGWNLTGRERFKVTAEYLQQESDYVFSTGNIRHWVQQGALGVDYQYLLTPAGLNFFDFAGYYAHAPNIHFKPLFYTQVDQGSLVEYTTLRCIAGADAFGINPQLTLSPWQGAQTNVALNYDHIAYDTRYTPRRTLTNGFGSTITLNQQLPHHLQLNLSAGKRAPFNTYQADIRYNPTSSPEMSIGIIAGYTQGKEKLPSTSVVGIELTYDFDAHRKINPLTPNNKVPLSTWVQKPAVYIPQILAIAEEKRMTPTATDQPPTDPVTPPSTPHPPIFSGNIPSMAVIPPEFNFDTSPYFTGSDLVFSATNLARGLSIDPTTGVISGFTSFSSDNVVVTATNADGNAQSNAFNLR